MKGHIAKQDSINHDMKIQISQKKITGPDAKHPKEPNETTMA